ncbi:hypothetical protein [Burkholderia stagnalis]|uniref:hypothetical protein n=1 Tax=Burkholderia stagnalis TaxID=1503054 RepID=UPI000B337D6E|nr:hypothetical protein [Burkholderia stagnalis]
MKVGNSVRLAIDDWSRGEFEAAMLHSCNSVDGTAKKLHSGWGNKKRFTQVIRDNYGIFGPMALPGINVAASRFHHVVVQGATTSDGVPDVADVVYGIHRCTHGHGDELPEGFELVPDAHSLHVTHLEANRDNGSVRLSDRTIFGLLAIAVLAPVNRGERVPAGYYLTYSTYTFPINDWWGRADDFMKALAQIQQTEPLSDVLLDFSTWGRMADTAPDAPRDAADNGTSEAPAHVVVQGIE